MDVSIDLILVLVFLIIVLFIAVVSVAITTTKYTSQDISMKLSSIESDINRLHYSELAEIESIVDRKLDERMVAGNSDPYLNEPSGDAADFLASSMDMSGLDTIDSSTIYDPSTGLWHSYSKTVDKTYRDGSDSGRDGDTKKLAAPVDSPSNEKKDGDK